MLQNLRKTGVFEQVFSTLASFNRGSGCIPEMIPDIASGGVNGNSCPRRAVGEQGFHCFAGNVGQATWQQ